MSKLPSLLLHIVIINIMITNSTNRILSTCQVLVLKVFHPLSLLISSLQIRLKRAERPPKFPQLCSASASGPVLFYHGADLAARIPASGSCSVLTCPLWCPSLNSRSLPLPPFPWALPDPAGFSSDAAINDMSSPGGHSHQQLPNQPGKACAETKLILSLPRPIGLTLSLFTRCPGDQATC